MNSLLHTRFPAAAASSLESPRASDQYMLGQSSFALLEHLHLPRFDEFSPDEVPAAIREVLRRYQSVLDASLCQTIDSAKQAVVDVLMPLEQAADDLSCAYSTVEHLHRVADHEALRRVYGAAREQVSEFQSAMLQNTALFRLYQAIAACTDFAELSSAWQRSVQLQLREFELGGVGLVGQQAQRYREISLRISQLSVAFDQAITDAEGEFTLLITDGDQLHGVPSDARQRFAERAKAQGQEGYLLGIDYPSYHAVMGFAENRVLRERLYQAYCTRASDQGPSAGRFDNSARMVEILALKLEAANLLGYKHYAQESLLSKMADSSDQVIEFLHDLRQRARPFAQTEMRDLRQFAEQLNPGIGALQAWDIGYFSERMKAQQLGFEAKTLRDYFPYQTVLSGLFEVIKALFGISVAEQKAVSVWHPDVRYFELQRDGQMIAGFYLDSFARAKKRSGAWMDVCRTRRTASGQQRLPIAYLTCNFAPPSLQANGKFDSLLSHQDVITLFHEFGHGLHHMLTEVDVAAVGGIQGVEWDAVELPSQFLENFCWSPQAIACFSGHIETGEPLPPAMLDKLLASKRFQSAMVLVRQLEFALFDLQLHARTTAPSIDAVLFLHQEIRQQTAVIQPPPYNRFAHAFSHIFAGGYSAGYYSYLWAEVLSADVFAAFPEQNALSAELGKRFVDEVLSVGASRPAMASFEAFMGRPPHTDALLTRYGLEA